MKTWSYCFSLLIAASLFVPHGALANEINYDDPNMAYSSGYVAEASSVYANLDSAPATVVNLPEPTASRSMKRGVLLKNKVDFAPDGAETAPTSKGRSAR